MQQRLYESGGAQVEVAGVDVTDFIQQSVFGRLGDNFHVAQWISRHFHAAHIALVVM